MAELSTLARPYAKAAFEYALDHNQLTQWHQQLATAAAVVADERRSEGGAHRDDRLGLDRALLPPRSHRTRMSAVPGFRARSSNAP